MPVSLPGQNGRQLERLRRLTAETARVAAGLAGTPRPVSRQEPVESLAAIRSALAVMAEKLANQEREVAMLRAERDAAAAAEPWPATRTVLTTAELRDRLRAMVAAPDGLGDAAVRGRLDWVIGRLDEILGQLGVVEYFDEGQVDFARNHVVDRRPTDDRHIAGTIASSVRSGLLLRGEILRPQDVVIYSDQSGAIDG